MNELVPALKDTIFNDNIKDASLDMFEAVIDGIGDNDILDEVPVFKTIIAVYKTYNKIHERHMLKETIKFIQGFNSRRLDEDVITDYGLLHPLKWKQH